MIKAKSVTLYDVADQAGVSYQTVSRVINQAAHVSAKTRHKVEQAMAALNYVPNRVAQQLAGKQSYTLGLATTDLALHAPSQIASSIKARAEALGFNVVISMVREPHGETCRSAVNSLLSQRVDGIIVNIPLEDAEAAALQQACGVVPALFLDVSPALAVNSILFDPGQGARLGVGHLLERGHRKIALVTGPRESVSARLRYEGWLNALATHGLTPAGVAEGDWSAASGYACTRSLMAQGAVTAILLGNDQMALGALRALSELGYAVPAQVSVVGYDDTEDSAWFIPPLTTVRQDFLSLGAASVERLVAQIRSPQQPHRVDVLAVTLSQRETTAAPGDGQSPAQLARALSALAHQVSKLSL
ncbi:LacI family DNA-binding transcriptional regulator [Pantoea sp. 1.19]|uniref:LacI family DNA-binding transcriptional regulator n=1 Tax=Pantoea sp. 1.19 TaxID=1925589 RepID=UPI000948DAEA|nr:LacI family DNA-binding transcriptional regulator [Pantoea sp. 1.19]